MLTYLRGEPGGEVIARLVADGENLVALHKLVLLQLYVDFEAADGLEFAEKAWSDAAGIFALDDQLDDSFLKRVARWRRELGGSGALAIAASLAEEHQAALVTHAAEPRLDLLVRSGLDIVVVGGAAASGESHQTEQAASRELLTKAVPQATIGSVQAPGGRKGQRAAPPSSHDAT